ncbi:DUF563 domain-containing protein [Neorhizobium sp. AL 9.2.2]|uniref:glycosyltransferase family 61 protein n=1 Tax=Neorhizobium sp. AL 9.2.2 TaxID=2712894 RepID=UPI001572D7E6|nr:glycosyltransferase family 61 protein [Neorhizobium sp. AL 9.2.2]NSY19998.1 glycosyltransferase family 61 protein [Neorhizobium sp. AL 9.2.2]
MINLNAQPWPYKTWTNDEVTRVVRIPPPAPQRLALPKVYGRNELPKADAEIKELYEQKPLDLNLYTKPCALLPGNVVLRPSEQPTVLPPTFFYGRHKWHGYIKRMSTEDDRFTYLKPIDGNKLQKHKGPVYFADADHPNVYGHVLFDMIAKLWAYAVVPKGTPVATTVKINRTYAKMMEALDIDPWNIVQLNRPTLVDECYFPGITFGRRDGIYPQAFDLFDRISQLKKQSDVSPREKIYVSRRLLKEKRRLTNEDQVEAYYADRGFTIVHPQHHKIEDQIAIFAGARLIAGPAGSGLHNTLFSQKDTRVLIIASSAWLHVADIFIAQEKGDLGYVFGDPLVPATDGWRTNSEWKVDMDDVALGSKQHLFLN